jgi:hypothetical protein
VDGGNVEGDECGAERDEIYTMRVKLVWGYIVFNRGMHVERD